MVSRIVNRNPKGTVQKQFMDGLTMPPKTPLSTLRIVLVDDDELFAESLAALLADEEGIDVVGWVSNGLDAVDLVAVERPDVVVMDIAMPRMNGIEAARVIGREAPDTHIIMLSGSLFGERLERIAGKTGAKAYITKARVALDLVPVLRRLVDKTDANLGPAKAAFAAAPRKDTEEGSPESR